jgi:hypothetical protein
MRNILVLFFYVFMIGFGTILLFKFIGSASHLYGLLYGNILSLALMSWYPFFLYFSIHRAYTSYIKFINPSKPKRNRT